MVNALATAFSQNVERTSESWFKSGVMHSKTVAILGILYTCNSRRLIRGSTLQACYRHISPSICAAKHILQIYKVGIGYEHKTFSIFIRQKAQKHVFHQFAAMPKPVIQSNC